MFKIGMELTNIDIFLYFCLMKRKILTIILLMLQAVTAFSQMVGELGDDERIVRGTLPNGLTYYLVNNSSIVGYADFTFIQKTGIAMEDSASRGMTYLMECMALTETVNFPDGEIFTFIDNMGLDRTDGLVIDAGDYYTTYTFSDVPLKKNDSMVDSMLLAIYNMSSALIVDDRSVTRGKNFFRNVFSASETLEQRVKDSLARYYFVGTSLAPVSQKELFGRIDGYSTEDVRSFYRNRCRPDMQALVIAGDIDPGAVESKIRALFQVVPRPSAPLSEFPDSLRDAAGGGYFYFQDTEADCARVTFDYIVRPVDAGLRRTAIPFIYDYLSYIGIDIMQRRLQDALGDAPFYARSVSAEMVPFLNNISYRFSVECAPEDYVRAYEFILTEVERLLKYGVSGYEYRRSSRDYMMTLDETYRKRSSLDNKYYSSLCRNHFLDGYVMAGVELRKSYLEMAMEGMDSTDIYRFLYSVLADADSRTVVCTSPLKTDGLEYFAVDPGPVAVDTLVYGMTEVLSPKQVQKELSRQKFVNPSTGVVSRRLPNGATLAYRRITREPGRVYFEAVARGGVSLADEHLGLLRRYINDVARMSVIGGMNMFERNKLMDILQLSLSRQITVSERRISGSFSTGSEASFLELVSLYFQGADPDMETFGKYCRMIKGCEPYAMRSPERVFENLHARDVRSGFGLETEIPSVDSLDYGETLDFINSLFSNAADFSFIFVGDFDEQQLLSSVYSTVAKLPGRSAGSVRREENSSFFIASYDDEEEVRVPMEFPRRLHSCKVTFPSDLNVEDRALSEVTARVIEREVIRQLSLRGILADASQRFYRYPEEVLTIDFQFSSYGDIPDMGGIFAEIIEAIAFRGVSSGEVEGVRRNIILKDELRERVDLDWWRILMRNRYVDRKDFYTRREAALNAVTAEQVNEVLLRIMDEGRISLLSVVPEGENE